MLIDTTELNRLRWRCRRGMLELDIMLARFIDQYAGQFSEDNMKDFNILLDNTDNELWDLIAGKNQIQDERLNVLLKQIQSTDRRDGSGLI